LLHLLHPLLGEKKEIKIVASIEIDEEKISKRNLAEANNLEKNNKELIENIKKLKSEDFKNLIILEEEKKKNTKGGGENEVKKNKIKISLTEEEEFLIERCDVNQVVGILKPEEIKELFPKDLEKKEKNISGLVNIEKQGEHLKKKFFYLKEEYGENEGKTLYQDSGNAILSVREKSKLEKKIDDVRMQRILSDKFTSNFNSPSIVDKIKAGVGRTFDLISQKVDEVSSSKKTGSNILASLFNN